MRAAIYARISDDAEGEALGVGRQTDDCLMLGSKEGVTVSEDAIFVENDTGASTRSRKKTRPVFDELLRRTETGEFDVILAYSNSRLTRRPLELEGLISLHERTGVIYKTVVSGMDDLSTADGRMVARIKASVDAGEVERTAERVARAHLANAMTGRPVGGTRPFGWEYDKVTVIPEEAALIRQGAAALLNGESLAAVTREWNASGHLTSRGNPWKSQTVRQLLLSPRYAGWRVHRGVIATDKAGQPVRGTWTPILDQDASDRLKLHFTKPDIRTRKPRRDNRTYLLTGVLRCGICNAVMYGNRHRNGNYYYVCNEQRVKNHGLGGSGKAIDRLVTTHVRMKMNERANDEEARAPKVWPLQARYEGIQHEIGETMAALRGDGDKAAAYRRAADLEDERAEIEKDRTRWLESTTGPVFDRFTDEQWDALGTDRQRAHIETVLEYVHVLPATRRGNSFDPTRLQFPPEHSPASE